MTHMVQMTLSLSFSVEIIRRSMGLVIHKNYISANFIVFYHVIDITFIDLIYIYNR